MLQCSRCNDTSPDDAKFCIGCGKPIAPPEYTGKTVDLGRVNKGRLSANISGAPSTFVDYSRYMEYGSNNFAIPTGAPFPFIDFSGTEQAEGDYFIYRADLRAILQDPNTFVKKTNEGYDIYYFGRKIVFMD